MAASPYAYTLIETRIEIKQNKKTHKKDAKKIRVYVELRVFQQGSVISHISHVYNIFRSKKIRACRRLISIHMHTAHYV